MNENLQLESDYKKWLSYNDNISGYKNLYSLFQTVQKKESIGSFTLSAEASSLMIQQEGNEVTLQLIDEKHQADFLDYMQKHYLPSDNLDEWYVDHMQKEDKANNHKFDRQDDGSIRELTLDNLKVHPKETKYYMIRLFFSLILYASVAILLITTFVDSLGGGLLSLIIFLSVIGFFALSKRFFQGLFIGWVKGNSVKLNKSQYEKVYEIVEQQSKQLGLEVPEVFITHGNFNAFVTKLARKKYLVLLSELVETAINDDYEVLKFIIGHELGHLKRKHLSKNSILFPSMFIPFLNMAHSRGCEYTCDRIGFHFSKQGAFEGILMLATGKNIYSKINIDEFISSIDRDSFWFWLSEKFLSHPHISKRMEAVKIYSERRYD